jgi:hypothetical protein
MGFRRPLKYKFIACLFLEWAFLNFEKSKFCTIRTTLSLPLSRQTGEGIGFCQNMIVADAAVTSFNIMFYVYLNLRNKPEVFKSTTVCPFPRPAGEG